METEIKVMSTKGTNAKSSYEDESVLRVGQNAGSCVKRQCMAFTLKLAAGHLAIELHSSLHRYQMCAAPCVLKLSISSPIPEGRRA